MTTRTYYLPLNRISLSIINFVVSRVGCSIGDIRVNKAADTMQVPITCNDSDVKKIENMLLRYGMIEED